MLTVWTFRSRERNVHTFVPGNERSLCGRFVPGNESAWERNIHNPSAEQGKFASQRPTFYHCATPPTFFQLVYIIYQILIIIFLKYCLRDREHRCALWTIKWTIHRHILQFMRPASQLQRGVKIASIQLISCGQISWIIIINGGPKLSVFIAEKIVTWRLQEIIYFPKNMTKTDRSWT